MSIVGNKILYLGGFELPDKNAAAQRVMANAMLLREMGFEVTLVGVTKEKKEKTFEYNGFSCRCLKYPETTKEWLYQVTSFLPVTEIEMYSPDFLVLYNFPAMASLKIRRYCHQKGVKVIHDLTEWEQTEGWTPRDMAKRLDTWLRMRYCIRRMDGVIAISRYLYDYCKRDVNTVLVPPTVDLDNGKWNRDREIKTNSPITLVYAGSPGGGVKDRLDVIVDAVRQHKSIRLKVVGVTEEQFFEAFKREPENMENVEFKGRLTHEEAVKEVCDSDFQMLIRDHSRKNDAGFPTKLVESMSCGIPVIATVFSNITYYVRDGENGFLLNDGVALTTVMEKLEEMNSEEVIAMKKKCLAMKDFDYRGYRKEFEKLFV